MFQYHTSTGARHAKAYAILSMCVCMCVYCYPTACTILCICVCIVCMRVYYYPTHSLVSWGTIPHGGGALYPTGGGHTLEPFGNIWDILGQIWDTRQPAQAFKQQHRTPDNRGLNTNELKQFSAEVLHLDIYGTYMGHIWDI